MSFDAYLFFGGNCREAFQRYQEIFGGRLDLVTAADMAGPPPGIDPQTIMHAALVTDDGLLMGSDDPFSDPFGPVTGMRVNHSAVDAPTAAGVFRALCDGGELQMDFAPTEWSAGFGMCQDRFGTPWMIDVQQG